MKGGREEGRERGREGGREGEREGGREGGKEGGREGGREGREGETSYLKRTTLAVPSAEAAASCNSVNCRPGRLISARSFPSASSTLPVAQ